MRRHVPPDLRRKRHVREPIRHFFLYCEGGRTEPAYFTALQRYLNSVRISIELVPAAGVPSTLARKAADHAKELGISSRRKPANSFEERDEVWVVCDRDEHPHFEDAVGLCQSRGVGVARSNPCFEVWLILHLRDYDKPDGRDKVQEYLCELRPEYRRNKVPDCAGLVASIERAESRAKILLVRREKEGAPFGPPSTTVGELTSEIRSAAKKSSPL